MKLRNKKTGKIATVEGIGSAEGEIQMTYTIDNDETKLYLYCTPSLTTFNAEWEDYEEPKEYWYIDPMVCGIYCTKIKKDEDLYNFNKQIGNYFETEEDAEKAVEKLKAFKRLKDKCFRFYRWNKGSLLKSLPNTIEFACDDTEMWTWEDIQDDLDLLFGGEE